MLCSSSSYVASMLENDDDQFVVLSTHGWPYGALMPKLRGLRGAGGQH